MTNSRSAPAFLCEGDIDMSASMHSLHFPGALLTRGFRLYVWEVIPAEGLPVLYVGMTGDTSSPNAQSPFTRLSQHLGMNEHSNALRRHLQDAKIDPAACRSFELFAYGPILPEASTMDSHRPLRSKIAALESALRQALAKAGYSVLNDIKCRQHLDLALWRDVLAAFGSRFELLNPSQARSASLDPAK